MQVTVNGEPREIPDGTTVSELLALLQTQAERVVVELNLTMLKRAQHGATQLKAGDRVEVVRFVGGGAGHG